MCFHHFWGLIVEASMIKHRKGAKRVYWWKPGTEAIFYSSHYIYATKSFCVHMTTILLKRLGAVAELGGSEWARSQHKQMGAVCTQIFCSSTACHRTATYMPMAEVKGLNISLSNFTNAFTIGRRSGYSICLPYSPPSAFYLHLLLKCMGVGSPPEFS